MLYAVCRPLSSKLVDGKTHTSHGRYTALFAPAHIRKKMPCSVDTLRKYILVSPFTTSFLSVDNANGITGPYFARDETRPSDGRCWAEKTSCRKPAPYYLK